MKLVFTALVVIAKACQNFSYASDCQPGAADPTCNTNLCSGQFCRGEYQMAYDCSGSTCYQSMYGGFDCDLGLVCIDKASTGSDGYCQRMSAKEKAIYSSIVIGIFAVLIALICVCKYYKKKSDERQRIREQREAELMGEPTLPEALLNGSNPPEIPKSPPMKLYSAKLGRPL